MSRDDKGPVFRRPMGHQDRDVYTDKRTPPGGMESIPEPVWDNATDRYEGEELQRVRSRRPTPERISKLEMKHDELDKKVDEIHGDVREMKGKLDTALAFITDQGKTQRTRITTNGKVLIAIGTAAFAAIAAILKVVLS